MRKIERIMCDMPVGLMKSLFSLYYKISFVCPMWEREGSTKKIVLGNTTLVLQLVLPIGFA